MSSSLARLASLDLLAASLFFRLLSLYASSLSKSSDEEGLDRTTEFRVFVIADDVNWLFPLSITIFTGILLIRLLFLEYVSNEDVDEIDDNDGESEPAALDNEDTPDDDEQLEDEDELDIFKLGLIISFNSFNDVKCWSLVVTDDDVWFSWLIDKLSSYDSFLLFIELKCCLEDWDLLELSFSFGDGIEFKE